MHRCATPPPPVFSDAYDSDVEFVMARSKPKATPQEAREVSRNSSQKKDREDTKGIDARKASGKNTLLDTLGAKRKRAQDESRKMPFKSASREVSNERCDKKKRPCGLSQESKQLYALFRLDKKQDRSKTLIWSGEKELLELHDRLEAARNEAETILKRVHATMKKWLGLMVQIEELDVPREAREKDVGSKSSQSESLGDIARGMATLIDEIIDSWTVHDYELECFRARVKEDVGRKAFEDNLVAPQAILLLVGDIPSTWEALDAFEKLVDSLVLTMMKPATTNASWAAVNKPQSDNRVSEVTLALEHIKSAINGLL